MSAHWIIDRARRAKPPTIGTAGSPEPGGTENAYGDMPGAGRYSPGEGVGIQQRRVEGRPDPKHVSYAERANLTLRMGSRRFTRLTNAFSKKVENHAHSVAIHTMHYNFVRIHQTVRLTPAMAAGVTTKLWELADMVVVLEEWEARQARAIG